MINDDPTLTMEFDNVKRTDGGYTKQNPKIEKSCGVIVYRDCAKNGISTREFLLLRYPEGHWDFAKGHVEDGESEKETARREFTEETGMEGLEFHDGFRDHLTYQFYANFPNLKGWIRKTVVFFVAKTNTCETTELSHEHRDFLWLEYESALKKISFENARKIFINATAFINKK